MVILGTNPTPSAKLDGLSLTPVTETISRELSSCTRRSITILNYLALQFENCKVCLVTALKRTLIFLVGISAASGFGFLQEQPSTANDPERDLLVISSITVRDKSIPINPRGEANLGAFPENIVIHFEPTTNWDKAPVRLRYRLDGYENSWREGNCEMYVTARFFNDSGDQVNQSIFRVNGESPGWSGSIKTSSLTHRRESLTVPPHATRLMIVISSAGPPATEGVYVVANLAVTRKTPGQPVPVTLIQSPFDQQPDSDDLIQAPHGWMRDGNHPSMAKIVQIGRDPTARAFAIYDDDPISHAEWRNTIETAPLVTPGDFLTIEWNEMYSMGVGDFRTVTYNSLLPGSYAFRVEEVNIFGIPTGIKASVDIIVPPPFWRTAWFWGVVSFGIGVGIFGTGRYLAWHKIQREMMLLKNQQTLEQERLRIAHDIHDDLGARVTQISLLSAMAEENPSFPDKARAEFGQVSLLCRELVFALYETVWAVNPENDNLDALGNYVCQMVNRLCERSQFRCRFYVSDLPRHVQVSSNIRHNISLTVKEAVHNVVKHSNASEVIIRIEFKNNLLNISLSDDGCGFDPSNHQIGHGLANMRRRLETIGGACVMESQIGKGTTVHIRLNIRPGGSPAVPNGQHQ
jgi:signal transduction histidine kinase